MFEIFAPAQPPSPVPVTDEESRSAAAEWATCSGAVLAKLLADGLSGVDQIADSTAGDARLFDMIAAATRTEAWAVASRARLIATAHARALAEHQRFGLVQRDGGGSAAGPSHGYDDEAFTRSEIAANVSLELGWSMPIAEREVGFALGLTRDTELRMTLATGRIDAAQARAMVDELDAVADTGIRAEVVASLITDPALAAADEILVRELRIGDKRLWELPPLTLRAIIRREVARRDPSADAARADAAREGRHVRLHQRRDAMADLVVHGPAELVSAAYRHLDLAAWTAKKRGARESIVQLRHDIACGWLTEGAWGLPVSGVGTSDCTIGHVPIASIPGQRGSRPVSEPRQPGRARDRIAVGLTMPITTALGLDDIPATLHGPGGPTPLPAELARRIAFDPEQAVWRRILCDPATGVATDVSTSYRPPPRIAEWVDVRDGHRSRFPIGAGGRLEVDHVVEYDQRQPALGGRTTAANLASQGLRDHHLKTDRAITVSGDANDVLVYRTRAGRTFESRPYQYVDPVSEDRAAHRVEPGPDPPF